MSSSTPFRFPNGTAVRVTSASKDYWPAKYNTQRESVPEIPRTSIEELIKAVDTNMDGRISLKELQEYGKRTKLLTLKEAREMFYEITERRALVHKEQLNLPITLDELQISCNSYFNSYSKRKAMLEYKDSIMGY